MRWPTAIVILGLATIGYGCSGGSGSGVIDKGLTVDFTPDEPSPGSNTVSLALEDVSDDTATIGVDVTDTNGVFSAALDLIFDPTVAVFAGDSPGDLLESAGTPIYLVSSPSEANQTGRIVVGVSLPNGANPVDVTESATLVHLTFTVTQAGTSQVDFENEALHDEGAPPQDLTGIGWHGGAFIAN